MRIALLIIYLFLVIGCNNDKPKLTENKVIHNDNFWKNRNTMNSTIETKEYPIAKDTTISEQRTNRIYLRSSHCQFEVFVNDVILFKVFGEITKNGAGVTGAHDINQLLLTSGEHEVKVRMYPKYGLTVFDEVGGYLDLTFSYFRDRDLRTVQYNQEMNGLNSIELSDSDKQWISEYDTETGAPTNGMYKPKTPIKFEGLPVYEWKKTFHAEVPFDYIGWRESVNLNELSKDEKDKLKSDLLELYHHIHSILKKKDTAAYLNLIKDREDLITSCLYYKSEEKILRQNEYVNLIKNGDYELQPLIKETFKLEYQGYGKLVMFLNKLDGESIIRLQNKKDPDDIIYLDFKFHKKTKEAPLSVI